MSNPSTLWPACFVTVTYFLLWGHPPTPPPVIVNPLSCNHATHLRVISTLICPSSAPAHLSLRNNATINIPCGWEPEQKVSTFLVKEAALAKEGEQEMEEIMWVPSQTPQYPPQIPHICPHSVSHIVSFILVAALWWIVPARTQFGHLFCAFVGFSFFLWFYEESGRLPLLAGGR